MGKPRGFLEDKRNNPQSIAPKERIKNYQEFYLPLNKEEQGVQGGRCMNCGVAFCHTGITIPSQQESSTHKESLIEGGDIGCPLQNLIPEWNDLIYRGYWKEAYERLNLTNPFPEFTGRVCPAPCEDSCVCAINGDSVTIKANELAIIENAFEQQYIKPFKPKKRTQKKIAIIGSGPSGLACAWELNKAGHQVSVFERSDRIGGLLMYGIPDMKLEKRFVERRVRIMQESGIEFKTNHNIKTATEAQHILNAFDYVVLATGASQPIDLNIEGRELQGIMFAMDFLTKNTKSLLDSKKPDTLAKDKHVLVIGSGDTSVDCIAVATRQGAKSITRFERSPKRQEHRSPSNPWPIKQKTFTTDYGIEEAIASYGVDPRKYQKLTKKFMGKNGKVSAVIAADIEWSEKNGQKTKSEIKDSEKEYQADLVLLAMGFKGTQQSIKDAFGVELDSKTNIKTTNYRTSNPKIYTCGDAKLGQSLVVWAIKDGLECAKALNEALG